jgi:enoyl-CoA hydratase/carnithine racemase
MELSSHNSVAVLAFPPTAGYSRLTTAVLGEIYDLLDEVEGAGLFSAVVIVANAKSFATGAEIEEVAAVEGLRAREFAERGQTTCRRIAAFPLPVVAAIRGYCLGGGLDLALACHGRVATYDASFGHPGAARGLLTGWGGTQRLPRLLGKATALEMLLTADRIPATQALSMGLVDALVSSPDLIPSAAQRAEALGGGRGFAIRRLKPAATHGWSLPGPNPKRLK